MRKELIIEQGRVVLQGSRLDHGRVIKIASDFCGTLFRTISIRKPTVTGLNFEINRIELYIDLMGERTFLSFFILFFMFTQCLSD